MKLGRANGTSRHYIGAASITVTDRPISRSRRGDACSRNGHSSELSGSVTGWHGVSPKRWRRPVCLPPRHGRSVVAVQIQYVSPAFVFHQSRVCRPSLVPTHLTGKRVVVNYVRPPLNPSGPCPFHFVDASIVYVRSSRISIDHSHSEH
jgi:hypothetical protein